jgi:hypothetical protein
MYDQDSLNAVRVLNYNVKKQYGVGHKPCVCNAIFVLMQFVNCLFQRLSRLSKQWPLTMTHTRIFFIAEFTIYMLKYNYKRSAAIYNMA